MPQKPLSYSQSSRPSPQTSLVRYLGECDNWSNPLERGLCPPIEDPTLLNMARNSVRGSKNNNDGLEFVGDRVTNLVCDLLLDRSKTTDLQYRVVSRVLSNNDTLGRLAHRLRLHEQAAFDPEGKESVAGWSPQGVTVPPKAMADLFEAHVGAVYVDKGLDAVVKWFKTLYGPLVPSAEGDFLGRHPGSYDVCLLQDCDGHPKIQDFQRRLVDSLTLSALTFVEKGGELLRHTPPSTVFTYDDKNGLANDSSLELIGLDIINLWVCKLCLKISPNILKATQHAAHLMTWVTYLATNDETLSILACFLGIYSYFNKSDPHYRPSTPIAGMGDVEKTTGGLEDKGYRKKLCLGLKALIAAFYLLDEEAANDWGEEWFKAIVVEAHALLITHPHYRLPSSVCRSSGTSDTPRKKPRTSTGPARDSPSRESPVPENSVSRKRPRTSLNETRDSEAENIPPWHLATPTIKNINQLSYSATLQKSSPAKPIESPSLKRVRTDSGVSSRLSDKGGNTGKPNIRSPLATPTSCKIRRKLSFTNDKPTPPLPLKPRQSATSSKAQPPKNREDCDPFV
ncbi:hypothetical protein M413DRAFT_148495 [Hebeloma cylindrosporum]|uniref:RNase III domain-containing protein n=1 Tax=Hebeloma cylindrosporum TaxID=76867 RepID=A0A0C3CCU1_HEBCY|nr:hypothetical protein M413DRAFT_148495 [Hebeloma cylindrosporum h7]